MAKTRWRHLPVQEGIPSLDGSIPDGLRGPDERLAEIPCRPGYRCPTALDALDFGPMPLGGAAVRGGATVAKGALPLLRRFGAWLGSKLGGRAAAEALQVGRFRLTETVGKHLTDVVKHGAHKGEWARPYLRSPHVVEEIMKAGKGVPDPGGVPGALRWDVPGTFRGSQGTWELVVDKADTILHFNFR